MIGAIIGDIVGSVYEVSPIKTTDFPLFSPDSTYTDDTVLTVAIAHALLENIPYGEALYTFANRYPNAGYGSSFIQWFRSKKAEPYNSWGNGSAMRVSPIGWAFTTEEKVFEEAAKSAMVTHNHREGIKGAQATALAVFWARQGYDKETIAWKIENLFGYALNRSLEKIRPTYRFYVSCQQSVPPSIRAFLESDSFEDSLRKAVSLGGDADTMAAIAGSIAHPFYREIPSNLAEEVEKRLPREFQLIINKFHRKYGDSSS